jgi:anti-sigma-K factor RskA
VTGCPRLDELVGGYVLGALEQAEMDQMRRHIAECPRCGREVHGLASLPVLLDHIEPADVPPPTPPPRVEEEVLDRFVRERARHRRRRRRPVLTTRRIAALAGVCAAALALALALVWPSGDDGRSYARARLAPPAGASAATATAYASDVQAGTRVSLRARDLPARKGMVYELWCVRRDGSWVSGGTFRAGRDGRAQAELTAAVNPGDYHLMVVTRRDGAAPEGQHGVTVLRGRLKY